MTEVDWATCADPRPMLALLHGRADGRKLRLFAWACCRRVAHLLAEPPGRDVVDVLGRLADGLDLPISDLFAEIG